MAQTARQAWLEVIFSICISLREYINTIDCEDLCATLLHRLQLGKSVSEDR